MIAELSDRFLRATSLVVTDRRWAATLSATALGFGLFVGVAIGPGASGTLAGSGAQIIEVPASSGSTSEGEEGEGGGDSVALAGPAGGEGGSAGGEASTESFAPAPPPFAPVASEAAPPVEEPTPTRTPAAAEEEPAEPETTELKGAVVHVNRAAGSYALAIKGGELVPVHARKLPQLGTKPTVEGLQLANGTFAEEEKSKSAGEVTQASFRGVVTFVAPDPAAPSYTVSGRGASLLVQVPPDPTGAVPPLPVLGARVSVTAAIEPKGILRQQKIEIEAGDPSTYLDLSGIYGDLSEAGQLLLSADSTRASEADLPLMISPKIKPAKLEKGNSYLATAEVEEDGSLVLVGIASDEYRKGADNPSLAQGDLKR